MTQEEKKLLLIDLCARLPYGVICNDSRHGDSRITEIDLGDETVYCNDFDEYSQIKCIKPYLRPLSSMTEEERKELFHIVVHVEGDEVVNQIKNNDCGILEGKYHFNSLHSLNWLNKKGFDYRGLLEKCLALPAPVGMY